MSTPPIPPLELLRMLRAAAEPRRLEVLLHLARGPRTGTDLLAEVPISQPTLSRHLAVLRDARLVEEARRGRGVVYSLASSPFVARLLDLAGWPDAAAGGVAALFGRSDAGSPPPDPGGEPSGSPDGDTPSRGDFQEWLL